MCDFGISRQPRGAALVIVMLVMAVLLMAGTAFLTISSTESQIALNEQGYAAAYALAEAGIHKAIALLNAPSLTYTGETNTALGGGTFKVTLAPAAVQQCPGNTAKDLTVTASVPVRGGNAVVTLAVTVDQVTYPYRWATFAAVPNQIVYWLWDPMANMWWDRTNSELLLTDYTLADSFDSGVGPYDPTTNSGLHGNVGANGDVEIDYNSTIDGNIQAGDDLFKSSGVTVTGTEASGLSPNPTDRGVPFPSVTPGVTPPGNLKVTPNNTVTLSASGGPYYYTNIKMGDNSALLTSGGPVTIYVTGPPVSGTGLLVDLGNNVTMGGGVDPVTKLPILPTQLQIITKSDGLPTDSLTWVTGDSFRLYGSLYGKNTDIFLGYSSQVYGSIIGRTIRARSGSNIHFDQAMINQKLCHSDSSFSPRFTIRRGTWQEKIPRT